MSPNHGLLGDFYHFIQLYMYIYNKSLCLAKSEDPDLGLHYFPMSHIKDAILHDVYMG